MASRPTSVVEDWTYGPARWLGAGIVAGAALIGILWSVSGRRVPVPEAAPAVGKAQEITAHSVKPAEASTAPAPDQAKPIVTMLEPRDPPKPQAESQPPSAKPAAVQANGKVDINSAPPEELEKLPGIGPALAARIVEDRAKNGKFSRLEDLDRVKGIGPKLLERIRPFAIAE
ncbi:MAG: helix-hairpin-helix domain-containing protein [Phycisphaerales bacterium]